VERARLIGLLRRAGMPLTRVAGVVDLEPGARRAAVEGWWASVEADVRERRALLDTLSRSPEEEHAVHDIALRPVPDADLLTAERRLTVEDLRVRRQGSGTEASTALTRAQSDFPQILGAYDALGRWIDDSHVRRAGSPAEVYLTAREVAPDVVHLEVVWPVSCD
jgi:hypothetical protein